MNVPLKKHHADWIATQVSAGRYASEAEAVEDAIAALIEEDDVQRLRASLKESVAQVERGETVAADDAFFQRLYDRIDRIARDNGR